MTTKAKTRLSVTIRPELKALTETIAKKKGTSTSKLVSECLEELVRNNMEKALIEYYETSDKERENFTKNSARIIQKIAASWSD